MAFCIYCGAKLPDSSKFCISCGKAVAAEEAAHPPAEIPEAAEAPEMTEAPEAPSTAEEPEIQEPEPAAQEPAVPEAPLPEETPETAPAEEHGEAETPETVPQEEVPGEPSVSAEYPVQPMTFSPPPIPPVSGTTLRMESMEEPPAAPVPPRKPRRKGLIALLIVVGVLLLAAVAVFVAFQVYPGLGNTPAAVTGQGEVDTALCGLWTVRSAAVDGEETDLSALGFQSFTLLLEETGEAVVTVNGTVYTAAWGSTDSGIVLSGYYGMTELELSGERLEGDYLGTGVILCFER